MIERTNTLALATALALLAVGCPQDPSDPPDDTGTPTDTSDADEEPSDTEDASNDVSDAEDTGGDTSDATDGGDDTTVEDTTDGSGDVADATDDATEGNDAMDAGDSGDPSDVSDTTETIDVADGTTNDTTNDTTTDDTTTDTSDATGDAVAESGGLVVTEFMADPDQVADSEGEWFEVYNPSSSAFDLDGCTIQDRGTDSHTISGTVDVGPGEYVTLARGSSPGFGTPDYVYGGDIVLANSGDEIIISCGSSTIDVVDYSGWSSQPTTGASKGLDPSARDATSNNQESNWCDQTSDQGNGDLGTPGAGNDDC